MTCKACHFWRGQFTATSKVKTAPGRCIYVVELPTLPALADKTEITAALRYRYAAWPDDGEDCPTFEALKPETVT